MTELPFRRIAWVLIVYAVVAWIVLRGAGWLQGVLALPPLFATLALVLVVSGVPLAVLVAWRYPELGEGGSTEVDEVAPGRQAEDP